CMQSKEFPFTF
nr:immunoglobulin light chain junction region [Macaca mulatta]MOV34659.1 immunoglobulin light chain junction region [Macaca mulatta]MOV34718.1 immunoglobulin light chain junction region [Macaca mulatta]MOV35062.1 immunoglobulin light chain junction region [Macaca mulatta]MOV35166.1 immunoglobulin light chain junction region [Macaca mulatta]